MASLTNDQRPLDETELRAWRGLLRAHALLVKRLDAELEAAHGLPLTSYEVLLHLSRSEGCKMRMCDVAESVLLSRSGLTRLVDRLERDGLVERVSCPDDARGAFARLTVSGREKLAAASTTHLEGIRQHFLAHFDRDELAVLADACERVAGPGCSI
ncbi:MAG TPA: MarR family transcriptional regulator [Solirubrobacteraceae bacterium]|nr:MarR family transcriptional regulator [Solirubrobacteraceae bacterium]